MIRCFEISWSDFNSDFQESTIESVIESLLEEAKVEGEKFLKDSWNGPKPTTWQEAYCRIYAIEYIFWQDWERGEADAEIPQQLDWADWLNDHLAKIAEENCYRAVRHMEIEVELN